ncbi:MAG TPA: aldo/keto reductase, partial [Chitinophagales bacterium]|nr:aldo/keto reductase [Chitinophagales bacterium]
KQKKLYGYLAHSAETILEQPSLWHELEQLKKRGLVEKTGVSVYHPHEIDSLLKMGYVPDLIQLPLNLLDHRFVPSLAYYKSLGIEIHSRSAFLQGLFFVEKDKIFAYFNPIKHVIEHVQNKFANKNALGAALLFHCLAVKEIDKVVIGVNDALQLQGLLMELKTSKDLELNLDGFDLEKIEDIEKMILPYNWPKN